MAEPTLASPRPQVDYEFLNDVEAEIRRALERAVALEAGLASLSTSADNSWQQPFSQMSESLTGWQSRLADLTRQTAALESDLSDQEQAMRGWFQALGITSERLEEMSKR